MSPGSGSSLHVGVGRIRTAGARLVTHSRNDRKFAGKVSKNLQRETRKNEYLHSITGFYRFFGGQFGINRCSIFARYFSPCCRVRIHRLKQVARSNRKLYNIFLLLR